MTDDEPTYTYVKGKGWVLLPFTDNLVVCKDGVTVRLEVRKPDPGEPYFYGFIAYHGEDNMKRNLDHVKQFNYTGFPIWDLSAHYSANVVVLVSV